MRRKRTEGVRDRGMEGQKVKIGGEKRDRGEGREGDHAA